MSQTGEGTRAMLRAVLEVAAELGREERERLGRDLTEAEAAELAALTMRQFKTALVISKL